MPLSIHDSENPGWGRSRRLGRHRVGDHPGTAFPPSNLRCGQQTPLSSSHHQGQSPKPLRPILAAPRAMFMVATFLSIPVLISISIPSDSKNRCGCRPILRIPGHPVGIGESLSASLSSPCRGRP